MRAAIAALGTGFLHHPANRSLRGTGGTGPDVPGFATALLRLAHRIAALGIIEQRGLLHPPEVSPSARRRYADLRAHWHEPVTSGAVDQPADGTPPDGARYRSLIAVLEALRTGGGRPDLGLAPLGGLFDHTAEDAQLAGLELSDAALWLVLRELPAPPGGHTASPTGRAAGHPTDVAVDTDVLGAGYEALLGLVPRLDPVVRTFTLVEAGGNSRKTNGTYYTPPHLVDCVLDTALDPVLDDAVARVAPLSPPARPRSFGAAAGSAVADPAEERGEDPVAAALLRVTVCDPSCGSGRFLVAAGQRIAVRVAAVRAGQRDPGPEAVRRAFRDVVERCLYGVDLDPLAVELTRLALWLASGAAGRPMSVAHVRQGNALIGATAEVPGAGAAMSEVPEGSLRDVADAWCTALLTPRTGAGFRPPGAGSPPERGSQAPRPVPAVLPGPAGPGGPAGPAGPGGPVAPARPAVVPEPDVAADRHLPVATPAERPQPAAPPEPVAGTAVTDPVARLRSEHGYFHWHLEFPEVFGRAPTDEASPGFDCVVGNPPWERIKLQEQEFFAVRDPSIATAARATDRKRLIARLLADPEHPPLAAEYTAARHRVEARSRFLRTSGRFPLAGRGDINTYAVFVEAARTLTSARGRVGLLVPTGIATDATTRHLFQDLVGTGALTALYDFENRRGLFPDVDSRFKFCVLALTGSAVRRPPGAEFAFFLQDPSELDLPGRRFTLTAEEIALLNPNTNTCPVFRSRQDADITLRVYRQVPVLSRDPEPAVAPAQNAATRPGPDSGAGARARRTGTDPWGAELLRMFDMSYDSRRFRTRTSLEATGWQLAGGTYRHGDTTALPLYEAKLAHHFDHRWATYTDHGALRALTAEEKADPHTTPRPRYWVTEDEVRAALPGRLAEVPPPWLIGFRNVCRSTDERSVIAAPLPLAAVGNSLPVLTFRASSSAQAALLAMVSSFVFDYVARQKAGGTNLNYFIIRQLPFLTPGHLARHESFVLPRVLELTYTSHDMAPFARSVSYHGMPFVWSEERRTLIRAELDALFLRLYRVGRSDVAHVLDSFPLVRRRDEDRYGHFRTRELILDAYDRQPHRPGFRTQLDPPPGTPVRGRR